MMHKVEIWQLCKCDGVKAKIGVKTSLGWLPQIGESFKYSPLIGSIEKVSHEFTEEDYVHIFQLKPQKFDLPIDMIKPPVILKINYD